MINTKALYYDSPYESRFQAKLLSSEERNGKWHLELDRTLFYPEGGGQPADKGSLNGVPVRDVQKIDSKIIHITDSIPQGETISGELDWNKRYYYMVQHTSQHLLSAALKSMGINTLSVHLGEENITIEVDRMECPAAEMEKIEDLANSWIRENISVNNKTVVKDREELEKYSLRRETSLKKDIRLVMIGQKDTAACAGVHVKRTGELGLIKYEGFEKVRGRIRLFWKAGPAAYLDYRLKHNTVNRANSLLATQTKDLSNRIEQLVQEKSDMAEQIRKLENLSAEHMVRTLSESINNYPPLICRSLPESSAGFFKQTVKKMSEKEGVSFLLTMKMGERLHWALYLPKDGEFHFDQFKKNCLSLINGKGGGKGPLWQGSGEFTDKAGEFKKAFLKMEGIEAVRILAES